MLCSVIIPLYNKGPFVEFAIQSVLAQTYQNFEIVVIDDGSKDDGPDRVKECADPRVRFYAQPNGGVSRARNAGIAQSNGQLICFLDADDWYAPEYLSTMVAMAEQFPSSPMFATSFTKLVDPAMPLQSPVENTVAQPEFIDNLFKIFRKRGAIFCTNSVAIRSEFLKQRQPCFPEGENSGEDLDLWFRIAATHPVIYLHTSLVGYRMEVSGSLCATHRGVPVLPVFQRLRQRANDKNIPLSIRISMKMLAADAQVSSARRALAAKERRTAVLTLLSNLLGPFVRRWWATWIMCMLPSAEPPSRWQILRETKKV